MNIIISKLFLARDRKSLQVKWNFFLVLREMEQVGQVGHGVVTALS